MKRILFGVTIIGCFAAVSLRAADSPPVIRALASIEMRYVEDGASDATLLQHPNPHVKAIVDLREKALPLLIECLADRESTSAVAVTHSQKSERTTRVPLGYLCLDILMLITDSRKIHVVDCADDGLGACVHENFYFRPDVYADHGAGARAQTQVAAVQKEWRDAFNRGEVTFVYPSWWTNMRR